MGIFLYCFSFCKLNHKKTKKKIEPKTIYYREIKLQFYSSYFFFRKLLSTHSHAVNLDLKFVKIFILRGKIKRFLNPKVTFLSYFKKR